MRPTEHCIAGSACPKCRPPFADATRAHEAAIDGWVADRIARATNRELDRLLNALTVPTLDNLAETMPVAAAELDDAGDFLATRERDDRFAME